MALALAQRVPVEAHVPWLLEPPRQLLQQLGGTYREIVGERVSSALVEFARSDKATQVVIGASRRPGQLPHPRHRPPRRRLRRSLSRSPP